MEAYSAAAAASPDLQNTVSWWQETAELPVQMPGCSLSQHYAIKSIAEMLARPASLIRYVGLHLQMASKDNDLSTEQFLMYGYKWVTVWLGVP